MRLKSLAAIDGRLEELFGDPYEVNRADSPSGHSDRQSVTNCLSHFALQGRGYESRTQVDAAALLVEGARCETVRYLRRAQPARRRLPLVLAGDALERFPALLAPAPSPLERELREIATRNGKSWRAYDATASLSTVAVSQARVTAAESITDIQILARADFDQDGGEDLLVLTVSGGTNGTWHEIHLRLLGFGTAGALLRVVEEIRL
ncbi:MAG: hypothetical protein ABUS79_01460 [Pseudomonadota bacterium]